MAIVIHDSVFVDSSVVHSAGTWSASKALHSAKPNPEYTYISKSVDILLLTSKYDMATDL